MGLHPPPSHRDGARERWVRWWRLGIPGEPTNAVEKEMAYLPSGKVGLSASCPISSKKASFYSSAQFPPSNPPLMPAVSACPIIRDLSASGNRTVENRGIGREPAAGVGLTRESSDAGDGLTQAWVDAQNDVKNQMRKMGIYVSSSSDEE